MAFCGNVVFSFSLCYLDHGWKKRPVASNLQDNSNNGNHNQELVWGFYGFIVHNEYCGSIIL